MNSKILVHAWSYTIHTICSLYLLINKMATFLHNSFCLQYAYVTQSNHNPHTSKTTMKFTHQHTYQHTTNPSPTHKVYLTQNITINILFIITLLALIIHAHPPLTHKIQLNHTYPNQQQHFTQELNLIQQTNHKFPTTSPHHNNLSFTQHLIQHMPSPHQRHSHNNMKCQPHNASTLQHLHITHHLNKFMIYNLTLTPWLSSLYTTNHIQHPIQNTYVLQNQAHDINPQWILITNIMHHIIYTHHKATHIYLNSSNIPLNIPTISNHTRIPNLIPTTTLINTTNFMGHIYYITHIQYKTPKIKTIKYYTWNNSALILQHGDVEPNPGPILKTLKNPPQSHTQKHNQSFTLYTLTLQLQYEHLEKTPKPYINPYTPNSRNLSLTPFATKLLFTNHTLTHPKQSSYTSYTPKHIPNMHKPSNLLTPHKNHTKNITPLLNQKPQSNIAIKHHTQQLLLILQCGDIHPNPGPMPDLLKTHPTDHKKRQQTYFIPSTIKLQPEYQHLAKTFKPILQDTHPLHAQTILTFPHLHQYIQTHINHAPPRIIYALIVTISPSIETCNTYLQLPSPQDWTSQLLVTMTTLTNPPERHINTPHPYTQFRNIYKDIITPPNTIHKKLYDYIHLNPNTLNIQHMSDVFPYLPRQLLIEALRYKEPINEYTHPNPPPTQSPPTSTSPLLLTSQKSYAITWNASSLNTAMPCLQDLITNPQRPPSIITIQEIKLSATKSTNHIQRLFPQYKLFFNNTHNITRVTRQRMTYRGYRGGLLLLIHKMHAFPGNLSKIPTPVEISPFLQITRIANQPLQPWLLINLYMPSHEEDIPLIPTIQNTITNKINLHPNHTYILCGDFNRDIALIGRQNDQQTTPPQLEDHLWRSFTTGLDLSYVPTNIKFSRQGGNNYTQNSLIDGFFIKTPNNNQYTSITNQNINLNSDHLPIYLQIPPNTLIARTPITTSEPTPRILNPIPKQNLEAFRTKFFETHSNQIEELTQLLQNNQLTNEQ